MCLSLKTRTIFILGWCSHSYVFLLKSGLVVYLHKKELMDMFPLTCCCVSFYLFMPVFHFLLICSFACCLEFFLHNTMLIRMSIQLSNEWVLLSVTVKSVTFLSILKFVKASSATWFFSGKEWISPVLQLLIFPQRKQWHSETDWGGGKWMHLCKTGCVQWAGSLFGTLEEIRRTGGYLWSRKDCNICLAGFREKKWIERWIWLSKSVCSWGLRGFLCASQVSDFKNACEVDGEPFKLPLVYILCGHVHPHWFYLVFQKPIDGDFLPCQLAISKSTLTLIPGPMVGWIHKTSQELSVM